jgi:hypothetical protein
MLENKSVDVITGFKKPLLVNIEESHTFMVLLLKKFLFTNQECKSRKPLNCFADNFFKNPSGK